MSKSVHIDILFVLIIFCVFSASALASLTLGGSVYKNILAQSQARHDERTSFFYIWTKIKNSDEYGRVYVDNFDGTPALVLEEDLSGQRYLTYIYCHDGWVKELFGTATSEYKLSDGQSILDLGDNELQFLQLRSGAIRISDSRDSLIITTRTGKAAG